MLSRFGFSQIETAIIRKDLKSLVRRREMARFLAIPIAVLIPLMLPFFAPTSTGNLPIGEFVVLPLYMGLVISALLFSMTGIGQEGRAVVNLYALPLGAREIVRAKASVTMIVTGLISTGLIVLLILVLRFQPGSSLAYYLVIFPVLFEESLFGLVIGTRYPDFAEGPRSRYVGIAGSLVGLLIGIILAVITLAPVVVYLVLAGGVFRFTPGFFMAAGVTLLIAGTVSLICYRVSLENTRRLLDQIPT